MYVKLSVSDTGKGSEFSIMLPTRQHMAEEDSKLSGINFFEAACRLKCPSFVTFQPHFLCRFGLFCDIWIL